MLLLQCVNAYAAAIAMMQKDWDYETAHALVLLKARLQPHADFFTGEEMKLVREFAKKDEAGNIQWNENGTFNFEQPERAQEYAQRRGVLGGVELQEHFPVLHAPVPASIKPVQLEALQGFIEFGDGGGGER